MEKQERNERLFDSTFPETDWEAKYNELEQATGRLYAAYNDVLAKNAMLIKAVEAYEAYEAADADENAEWIIL
jgi:hypothetical protein